jgi:hypothetical protein
LENAHAKERLILSVKKTAGLKANVMFPSSTYFCKNYSSLFAEISNLVRTRT